MTITKHRACETVARDLRTFGYPDVKHGMISEILDAWLAGKRGSELPHGVIGMMAGRQFNDIEDARPGSLAKLK